MSDVWSLGGLGGLQLPSDHDPLGFKLKPRMGSMALSQPNWLREVMDETTAHGAKSSIALFDWDGKAL